MNKATSLLLTLFAILATTTVTLLYSEGWRINKGSLMGNKEKQSIIIKTGMLAIRSVPDAARIFINGKAVTATDTTISSLKPGTYNLKIKKEGFEPWEKNIKIYPEVVTDITAILILQSPKLESLTNSDVNAFSLSSNGNEIAYLTQNHKTPGIWELPLTGTPLNLFKTGAKVLIEDNSVAKPSLGEKLWWSPNDKEMLIQLNKNGYLLYETPETRTKSSRPKTLIEKETTFKRWEKEWQEAFLANKLKGIKKGEILDDVLEQMKTSNYKDWAPDNEKFMFVRENRKDHTIKDLFIYNFEDPLPIDQTRLTNPLTVTNPENTYVYWYTDSSHLIIVERTPSTKQYTISLVRIDGTNNIPIYTGILSSPKVFSNPGGNQIIVRTSLKEGSSENLYGITIH